MLLAASMLAMPGVGLACVGDCNADDAVTVEELIAGVSMALGARPLASCPAFDRNASTAVEIDEVVAAVQRALDGCPSTTTPTIALPTTTPTEALPTATPTVPAPNPCTATVALPTPLPPTACAANDGGFVDCLASSGLDVGPYQDGENGAAAADVDADGLPDVLMWNTAGGARLYRNLGAMRFAPFAASPLEWIGPITVAAAAFGDLDNDGRPDLVLVLDKTGLAYRCEGPGPDTLNTFRVYRNVGGGGFEDVTAAWGFDPIILQRGDKPIGYGLVLVDLNFDARLDVVEYRRHVELRPLAFLSQADGTTWKEAGYDIFGDGRGPTWNVFFTDVNRDHLPDALILNDFWDGIPSQYLPRLDRSLRYEQRELLPVFGFVPSSSPMGIAAGDLDGDGELELAISDGGGQHLYSKGIDVAEAWNVAQNPSRFGILQNCWSPAVIDLASDGIPDLFFGCGGFRVGQPDRSVSFVLRNRGGGDFELASGVLPDEAVPTWEQGLAVADFDQDGRVDLLTGGEEQAPRLLWNRVPGGATLAVRLRGRTVNREGVGARVTVEADGLPIQVREMFPGGATWSYGDTQLLFGLGPANAATVTVDWRPAGGSAVQRLDVVPGSVVIEEPIPSGADRSSRP